MAPIAPPDSFRALAALAWPRSLPANAGAGCSTSYLYGWDRWPDRRRQRTNPTVSVQVTLSVGTAHCDIDEMRGAGTWPPRHNIHNGLRADAVLPAVEARPDPLQVNVGARRLECGGYGCSQGAMRFHACGTCLAHEWVL